jgi:hypothetical protein
MTDSHDSRTNGTARPTESLSPHLHEAAKPNLNPNLVVAKGHLPIFDCEDVA